MLLTSKEKPGSKCGTTFSKTIKILFLQDNYNAVIHNLKQPLSPS